MTGQGPGHFGSHLVAVGLTTTDDIVAALERQSRLQKPFGRLCMEHGFLSIRHVFKLLALQLDDPRPFGELAISQGYMTPDQQKQILNAQRDSRPRLGDILVQLGRLTEAQLVWALDEFHHRSLDSAA